MGGQTVYMPTFLKNRDSLKADINGTYAGPRLAVDSDMSFLQEDLNAGAGAVFTQSADVLIQPLSSLFLPCHRFFPLIDHVDSSFGLPSNRFLSNRRTQAAAMHPMTT